MSTNISPSTQRPPRSLSRAWGVLVRKRAFLALFLAGCANAAAAAFPSPPDMAEPPVWWLSTSSSILLRVTTWAASGYWLLGQFSTGELYFNINTQTIYTWENLTSVVVVCGVPG